MSKKYTISELQILYEKKGFIFLDDFYINVFYKHKTQCKCGKIFYVRPHNIIRKDIKATNSCGHCTDLNINDKINSLTVIDIKTNKTGHCSVKCKCGCGKETRWYPVSRIINGLIKSCGYCNNLKINDKFSSLTIIDIKYSKFHGCSIKCRCDCGKYTKWYHSNAIVSGLVKGCGNCYLQRNGRFTSHTALQLHNLVEQITNIKWEHNLHIKKIGCIDIANEQLKIAIEYDSYYNHKIRIGDRTQKDEEKIRKLLKSGWKVLHIKSDGRDIPTEKLLCQILLNDFEHNSRKRTITMKSWKQKEKI